MENITNKYLDMLSSFESDYNLLLNNSYGLAYMNQCIKRIKNNEKLTNSDKKILKDLDLLKQLIYDLNFGFVKIIDEDE